MSLWDILDSAWIAFCNRKCKQTLIPRWKLWTHRYKEMISMWMTFKTVTISNSPCKYSSRSRTKAPTHDNVRTWQKQTAEGRDIFSVIRVTPERFFTMSTWKAEYEKKTVHSLINLYTLTGSQNRKVSPKQPSSSTLVESCKHEMLYVALSSLLT